MTVYGFPYSIVEIAFVGTPYNPGSFTWEDVTTYVKELTIRRGRSDEFQEFDPGTATVVLKNTDRRFDPINTSSPYYPNVTPRRAIRISAAVDVSGTITYHEVFFGFVEGWPVTISDGGFNNTVTIEAVDILGLLAQEELPDDLADKYIRSLSPRHYWPLNDPIDPVAYTGQTLQDYGSFPVPLTPYSTFKTANCAGLAIGLADTAVSIAETDFVDGWSFGGLPTHSSTTSSLAIWFHAPQLTQLNVAEWGQQLNYQVLYDSTLSQISYFVITGSAIIEYTGTVALDLSVPHHLALNVTNSTGAVASLYVDAQPVTMAFASNTAASLPNYESFSSGQGRRQQAITFDRALTATEIETIYRLSRAIITESTAARFQRLMDYSPLPSTYYLIPTGTVGTVSGITTGGPAITTELQLLNDSEGGNLYVNKEGKIVMTGRTAFAEGRSLTSQATIGTTGITIGPEMTYRLDAETMRNSLTMGFAGEGVVEVIDQDSVDNYGTVGGTWSTQLSSQLDAENLGDLLVGFSSDPKVVISPVEVNASAVADDWNTILALELLDRITLTVSPAVGSVLSFPQLLQSIEHRSVPGQWSTTLNGSVRFTNPFILDSSLLDGPDLLI